jgi:hypothetical protein
MIATGMRRRRRASLMSCPSFRTALAAGTGRANDEWLSPRFFTSIYTAIKRFIVHYYGRYADLPSRMELAFRPGYKRRHECRRGTHECARHEPIRECTCEMVYLVRRICSAGDLVTGCFVCAPPT